MSADEGMVIHSSGGIPPLLDTLREMRQMIRASASDDGANEDSSADVLASGDIPGSAGQSHILPDAEPGDDDAPDSSLRSEATIEDSGGDFVDVDSPIIAQHAQEDEQTEPDPEPTAEIAPVVATSEQEAASDDSLPPETDQIAPVLDRGAASPSPSAAIAESESGDIVPADPDEIVPAAVNDDEPPPCVSADSSVLEYAPAEDEHLSPPTIVQHEELPAGEPNYQHPSGAAATERMADSLPFLPQEAEELRPIARPRPPAAISVANRRSNLPSRHSPATHSAVSALPNPTTAARPRPVSVLPPEQRPRPPLDRTPIRANQRRIDPAKLHPIAIPADTVILPAPPSRSVASPPTSPRTALHHRQLGRFGQTSANPGRPNQTPARPPPSPALPERPVRTSEQPRIPPIVAPGVGGGARAPVALGTDGRAPALALGTNRDSPALVTRPPTPQGNTIRQLPPTSRPHNEPVRKIDVIAAANPTPRAKIPPAAPRPHDSPTRAIPPVATRPSPNIRPLPVNPPPRPHPSVPHNPAPPVGRSAEQSRPVESQTERSTFHTMQHDNRMRLLIAGAPDYTGMNPPVRRFYREHMIAQLQTTRRDHPQLVTESMLAEDDLYVLHAHLQQIRQSLEASRRADYIKLALKFGFHMIEQLGMRIGFDMRQYAETQLRTLSLYEGTLVSIGEQRRFGIETRGWSPEVRLLFVLVANTVLFIIAKMFLKEASAQQMANIQVQATQGFAQIFGGEPARTTSPEMPGDTGAGGGFGGLLGPLLGAFLGSGQSAPVVTSASGSTSAPVLQPLHRPQFTE